MRKGFVLTAVAMAIGLVSVPAQAEPASSVQELLARVRGVVEEQSASDQERLRAFRANRNEQKRLLEESKARLKRLEQRSRELEAAFSRNEKRQAELEADLKEKQGTRGELFGVARQVAGDVRALLDESLVSAEHPGRAAQLKELAEAKEVPSIDQLQKLWLLMQEEMTWSREVSRFEADVVSVDGKTQKMPVTRLGTFTAATGDKFLLWSSTEDVLVELGRQPSASYQDAVEKLARPREGFVKVPVDPSRGTILSLLVETPSFLERISFGGVIGYIVIGLGAAAFLFGLLKLAQLLFARAKVNGQLRSSSVRKSNPLGRILALSDTSDPLDAETFEARLEEGVLRESAKLEAGIWVVRVVQVAAPLLGLLGTVTGMINTFQAITLFGTGDPRLMAGGISEALVTTMLGLMVAIPLVLLGNLLSNLSQRIIDILDEQAAGLVADRLSTTRGAEGDASGLG